MGPGPQYFFGVWLRFFFRLLAPVLFSALAPGYIFGQMYFRLLGILGVFSITLGSMFTYPGEYTQLPWGVF